MTRSPLRCCTSIIRSFALVQASSSLSINRTRAWPQTSSPKKFYFRHGFRWVFCFVWHFGGWARFGILISQKWPGHWSQVQFECLGCLFVFEFKKCMGIFVLRVFFHVWPNGFKNYGGHFVHLVSMVSNTNLRFSKLFSCTRNVESLFVGILRVCISLFLHPSILWLGFAFVVPCLKPKNWDMESATDTIDALRNMFNQCQTTCNWKHWESTFPGAKSKKMASNYGTSICHL